MAAVKKPCGTYAAYQRHYKAGERCEECWSVAKEYQRIKYLKAKATDPDRLRRQSLEADRRRKAKDPEAYKLRSRYYTLMSGYGLDLDQWEEIFDFQDRKCARCGTTTTGKFNWATDHNHDTGQIRGILCHGCNNLIGRFGDNATELARNTMELLLYLWNSNDSIDSNVAADLIQVVTMMTQ